MKKLINAQVIVLLIGTVFAWTNFSNELFAWLNDKPCETGCSVGNELVNPFLTPCFYGAVFFTLAFIISIMTLIAAGRSSKKEENESSKEVKNIEEDIKEEKNISEE